MATTDEELERLLREINADILGTKKKVEAIEGELGIRWPGDTGIKSRLDALERHGLERKSSEQLRDIAMYSLLALELGHIVLTVYLIFSVARIMGTL